MRVFPARALNRKKSDSVLALMTPETAAGNGIMRALDRLVLVVGSANSTRSLSWNTRGFETPFGLATRSSRDPRAASEETTHWSVIDWAELMGALVRLPAPPSRLTAGAVGATGVALIPDPVTSTLEIPLRASPLRVIC